MPIYHGFPSATFDCLRVYRNCHKFICTFACTLNGYYIPCSHIFPRFLPLYCTQLWNQMVMGYNGTRIPVVADMLWHQAQSWRARTYMGKLGGGHSCLVLFCLPKSRIAEAFDAAGSTTCRMRDHETRWRWLLCHCELFIQQFRKRFILSKPGAWWIFHVSFRFKWVHVHPPSYIHHKPTRLWSITQYISLVYNRHTQIYNDLCVYIYIYHVHIHTYIHTYMQYIQYNTIQYNTIQSNTIQYKCNTIQIQYKTNTIQYNTTQYNTTQYKYQYNTIPIPIPIPIPIQYNTIQYNHTYIHTYIHTYVHTYIHT